MLSRYARNECLAISAAAAALGASCYFFGVPALIPLPLIFGACLLLFYRDPKRMAPKDRNVAVSPADGKISSIHEVPHFEPFGGPAVCVRVFLSVFDVHVNYCPCHALAQRITHKPGEHLSVLNPRSAEVNEAITTVFYHPTHRTPLVAVRQIAGLLARTVHCALSEGQVVQRGAKLGIMKIGSTAELYLPVGLDQVLVRQGQRVVGGVTPLAMLPHTKPNTGENTPESALDDAGEGQGDTASPAAVEDIHLEHEPMTLGGGSLSEDFDAPAPAPLLGADVQDDDGRNPENEAEAEVEADLEPEAVPELPPLDSHAFVETPSATDTAIIPSHSILPLDHDDASDDAGDLTDHAITQVMAADEVTDTSHALTAAADGEVLTARMENAGTDLMLHPAEHGDENETLAVSLAGLRPEAHTDTDDVLRDVLPVERQPGADHVEDSGDWKIIPSSSKKAKKPKASGLLWEDPA